MSNWVAQWPWVRLSDVVEIQLGKMLSPASRTGRRPVPYLRNANVQWNRFALRDVAEMDFDEREEAKFLLRRGDVLVCEGGEPGRAAVWDGQIDRCCYQKALHRLRPINDGVDPQFLVYRLWLGALRGEFTDEHAKTTIAHLPAVRLANLRIALPSVSEQRRIAATLTDELRAVDHARSSLANAGAAVAATTEAILRRSLSGPTSPVSLGDALDEVKNGIGSGWPSYRLVGATRAGLAPAKEGVGKFPEKYKLVGEGVIFYNPMRILIGSIAHVDVDDEPGITSPDYVVFRTDPDRLDDRWLYHWLRSWRGDALVKSLARGAVRERLLFTRLSPAVIDTPPIAVQRQASRGLLGVSRLSRSIEGEAATIEALPRALLQRAFQELPA